MQCVAFWGPQRPGSGGATNHLSPALSLLLLVDKGRLHHKCNRLRLLATCLITVTNKQNDNAIDYDYGYIESNHGCNRDYICLFAYFCLGVIFVKKIFYFEAFISSKDKTFIKIAGLK